MPMTDVTRILSAIEQGDPSAAEQLLPLVYDELRKLAAQKMAQEKPGQTLQATALVHEAYIRLVDAKKVQHWNSRGHFFAAAAEAMRRILVENARRKRIGETWRREGSPRFGQYRPGGSVPGDDLVALDEALEKLERIDAKKAAVVKLRYFAGLTVPQAAEVLGVSASTVDNYWAYARAWLRVEMALRPRKPPRSIEFLKKPVGGLGDSPFDFALVDRRTSR